jgi:hypothetical protein
MALAYLHIGTQEEREEALRALAIETLLDHSGVLFSLTPEQHRTLNDMDPGPTVEVGKPPK